MLTEWKKVYRHRLPTMQPLDVNALITKKGLTDHRQIAKLTAYVTIINRWLEANTSPPSTAHIQPQSSQPQPLQNQPVQPPPLQPLNDNQQILNAPIAPSISSSSTNTDLTIQQLQFENERLQHALAMKELQEQIQAQQRQLQEMKDKMEVNEHRRKNQVSYLRKEKAKKKVCVIR